MDITIFDAINIRPRKKTIFKFITFFPIMVKFNFIKLLCKHFLPNIYNCQIQPGFSAIICSNIHAKDVNLNDTKILDYAVVTIGEGTKFSGENIILTSTHDLSNFERVIAKPIVIGKNVWITYRVVILGGVTIGNNSVIGAGSVVTKNIPSNVIAAGNPCKVIKNIDGESIRQTYENDL